MWVVFACSLSIPLCAQPALPAHFAGEFRTYFDTVDIEAAQISPTGKRVAYITRELDEAQDRWRSVLQIMDSEGGRSPVQVADVAGPFTEYAWSPDGERLAYIEQGGEGALVIYDVANHQAARFRAPWLFRWSPTGKQIAMLDLQAVPARGQSKGAGVLVDRALVDWRLLAGSAQSIAEQAAQRDRVSRPSLLEVEGGSITALEIGQNLNVQDLIWSPDGRSLALTANPPLRHPAVNYSGSNLYIYSIASKTLSLQLPGGETEQAGNRIGYYNVRWSPDGKELFALRYSTAHRFTAIQDILFFRPGEKKPYRIIQPWRRDQNFTAVQPAWLRGGLVMEDLRRARRSLFRLTDSGDSVDVMSDTQHDFSNFSFSRQGDKVAFVRQSLSDRPVLCIGTFDPEKRSLLQQRILFDPSAGAIPPRMRAEALSWRSFDGTTVYGWLITANDLPKDHPHPLVAILHGIPGVVSNQFNAFFFQWSYPLEAMASRGYAIFIPNFRESISYGIRYQEPTDVAKASVEDVISGVEHLIARGIADPTKLGLAGHSGGYWTGAMTLATYRGFRAASLAEGFGDVASGYMLNTGNTAVDLLNYYWGGGANGQSLFDNPHRYLERSPAFKVSGLETAVLLENGDTASYGQALLSMPLSLALWLQKTPFEWYVYARTSHNPSVPSIEAEIAQRNLDWFAFWLEGKENSKPDSEEQYLRWRKLRRQQEELRIEGIVAKP